MANYNGRVTRSYTIPETTREYAFVQCAACGKQDDDNGSNAGFWRMIPPIAGWDSTEENWACIDCLNKINAIFGVPPKEA
jgi:hypothetical protein